MKEVQKYLKNSPPLPCPRRLWSKAAFFPAPADLCIIVPGYQMGVLAEGPALEEPSNEIGPRCPARSQAGKECRGLFHSLIGNICAAFTFFLFLLLLSLD